jgi:CHASE2 domain-containing sensor protein
MPSEDDDFRAAKKLRTREMILALFIGFLAVGGSVSYIAFAKQLGWPLVIALIILEILVMTVVYFILVSQMRKRR